MTRCHACRITLELRDRQTKVDVLHAKFQMLSSRAHGTDADGGEPKSQAYYIVKVGILVVVQCTVANGLKYSVMLCVQCRLWPDGVACNGLSGLRMLRTNQHGPCRES